jgi:hypothetical protein
MAHGDRGLPVGLRDDAVRLEGVGEVLERARGQFGFKDAGAIESGLACHGVDYPVTSGHDHPSQRVDLRGPGS